MLLLYQRVSTTEQAGEGRTSLEDQERIGRGFAMAKGFSQFDVSCYCDAGVSATIPLRNRPAGKEAGTSAEQPISIAATARQNQKVLTPLSRRSRKHWRSVRSSVISSSFVMITIMRTTPGC